MRAAQRQGVLGVVRCKTGLSPRVRARAPPVQHLFRGGYKQRDLHEFQGGQRKYGGALVQLRKKKGAGVRGEATAIEPVLAAPFWGMLYADDAGVVSHSPEQLRKMTRMIVVVHAVVGFTVSEAKTEIMCLRAKGMPESTATFSAEAAGQVYNQTNKFVYLEGTSTTMPTCPSRLIGAYTTHGAASGSTPSKCTTDRALPSSLNSEC